uniref:Uncharacterized LOC100182771 n=2 Tax=Ciona intestinalis TaxID=7719 RepID=H2XNU8_CIOIN
MYLKYLPKSTHFSHACMNISSMLAALDHNHNVTRPQAIFKSGENEGEPRYKILWSRVHKKFTAKEVKCEKDHSYLFKMLTDIKIAVDQGNIDEAYEAAMVSIAAPTDKPDRNCIIEKTKKLSRFHH